MILMTTTRQEGTAMEKLVTKEDRESRIHWEQIEEWTRSKIEQWLQGLLEAEVTEFLGRARYRRREQEDEGYRNGYGKPRRLTMRSGTVTVRRPRVRGLQQRFVSNLLPLFVRRTREVGKLLPELYLHGLSLGDFDMALRGLLGEEAPLSGSTVGRLKEGWQAEAAAWQRRSLAELDLVYLWVDGVYVKAGLEQEKAAVLVAIGGLSDGSKVIVSVQSGYRESSESWKALLRDLRERGMGCPRLVVGDGHLGIWSALAEIYPQVDEQRCWNHRTLNVLDQVPRSQQPDAKAQLREITYAESRGEAERRRQMFQQWASGRGFHRAAELIEEDWDRMVSFYRYPKEHWRHLRTTNVVESPFAALRLRTAAAKRFKKVTNATAVIWKMLMVAESRFRKLNAPELLLAVKEGVEYRDGVRVGEHQEVAA